MPTTHEESATIIKISSEYLPIDKLAELFRRLKDEVGDKSDNYSVRDSLIAMAQLTAMASAAMQQKPKEDDDDKPNGNKLLQLGLQTLVGFHFFMLAANAASLIAIPFFTPWYIAFPMCTYLVTLMATRVPCPLTLLENYLRKQLGMRPIGGFVGHYIMRPLYAYRGKRGRRSVTTIRSEV